MIPPPNVTGTLHMGHAFNNTVMDSLIRYHRMCGDNTLYGSRAQTMRALPHKWSLSDSSTRPALPALNWVAKNFLKKSGNGKNESGNTISQQLERLGSSVDWSRERFTMDKGLSQAVREVFVRLYHEGLHLSRQTPSQLGSCLAYRRI